MVVFDAHQEANQMSSKDDLISFVFVENQDAVIQAIKSYSRSWLLLLNELQCFSFKRQHLVFKTEATTEVEKNCSLLNDEYGCKTQVHFHCPPLQRRG